MNTASTYTATPSSGQQNQITGLDTQASGTVFTQFNPLHQVLFANAEYVLVGEYQPLINQVDQADITQIGQQLLQEARHSGNTQAVLVAALPFHPEQKGIAHLLPQPRWMTRQQPEIHHQMPQLKQVNYKPTPQQYQSMVAQALDAFELSQLRKVVLGRTIELEFEQKPDLSMLLARLATQNSSAFTFALPLIDPQKPSHAHLIGASPELLLSKRGNQIRMQPMAGTLPLSENQQENIQRIAQLRASPKDRYEHEIMIEAIRERLSPLCHTLNIPDEPEVITTSTLLHLATPIRGELKDPSLSVLELVKMMHPTPAVCGVPHQAAQAFIAENEPERGLFAGAIGWCDMAGDGDWAVTIRCAECQGQRIKLFAGAGVVPESTPKQEYAETAAKFRTMLKALGVELPKEAL